MSDLQTLYHRQDQAKRWRAEWENTAARMELANRDEHAAFLISQADPVEHMGIDRERLRLCLQYIIHGDIKRLYRDYEQLYLQEAKAKVKP